MNGKSVSSIDKFPNVLNQRPFNLICYIVCNMHTNSYGSNNLQAASRGRGQIKIQACFGNEQTRPQDIVRGSGQKGQDQEEGPRTKEEDN